MSNIIINTNCNRQCVYCFSSLSSGQTKENKQMSFDTLTLICDFLQRSQKKKVNILGGEPTLHPQFPVFLEYLVSREFVIHVFSNGIIPPQTLAAVNQLISKRKLTRRHLKFVVNVNEDQYRTQPERDGQARTFEMLHDFCSLSFNIFEKKCSLDFLKDLITDYDLIPEVRLGLAAPIMGKANRFLALSDYNTIARNIVEFSDTGNDNNIDLVFDCGFPLCIFSYADIGKLYKNKAQIKFICQSIPDIDPDLNVFHCFPLSGYYPQKLTDFNHLREIHMYFDSLLSRSRNSGGIFETCRDCRYKERGMCAGGCKGHYLEEPPGGHNQPGARAS